MLKRIFDLFIGIPALIISIPFMVIVGLIILFTMGRPVLFRQRRPGFHGKPFMLYKFRTMTDKRDGSGKLLPDEKRLTRAGRWIRRLSLDELPQLFNVIRGDMSIVGPRPLLMEYLSRYTPEQARRHEVKPGITGWAQINGRNATTWEERFKLDLWYVEHHNLWLDIKIILYTLLKVLKREGINQPGSATMEEFKGLMGNP